MLRIGEYQTEIEISDYSGNLKKVLVNHGIDKDEIGFYIDYISSVDFNGFDLEFCELEKCFQNYVLTSLKIALNLH